MENLQIAILMATYNGAKYIREQLDSIFIQSNMDFKVYISDDGSSDTTLDIIEEYRIKYPSHIVLLPSHPPFGSPCRNFLYALQQVKSDVYLFCDQDDVWTPDHVQIFREQYERLNSDERAVPVLIHSDVKIVDSELNCICDSGFKFMRLPQLPRKYFYFIMNNVIGCASMINDKLRDFVFHNQNILTQNLENVPMHDNFFACIAVMFGKKIMIPRTTTLYRQHGGNICGAGNQIEGKYRNLYKKWQRGKGEIQKSMRFANFYAQYFENELDAEDVSIIKQFSSLDKIGKIRRIFFICKHGFLRHGFLRNLWLCVLC